jgi:hypothetical protein
MTMGCTASNARHSHNPVFYTHGPVVGAQYDELSWASYSWRTKRDFVLNIEQVAHNKQTLCISRSFKELSKLMPS